jgi:hypothetical protein
MWGHDATRKRSSFIYATQKEYPAIKPDPLEWKSSDGVPASALHRDSGSSTRQRLSMPGGKTIEAPTHL